MSRLSFSDNPDFYVMTINHSESKRHKLSAVSWASQDLKNIVRQLAPDFSPSDKFPSKGSRAREMRKGPANAPIHPAPKVADPLPAFS